jgi:hypothetical protein
MHVSGQNQATTANSDAVTDESDVGGPTVKDSLNTVAAELDTKAGTAATATAISDAVDALGITFVESSGEFATGVPLELYRYSLDEGEVVGISVTLVGGWLNTGVTERSLGRISAVASRDVGGGAARTEGTGADEVGTITGGAMSSDVDGNDVVFFVTYTDDGSLVYRLRVELDSVAVPQDP